MNRLAAAVLLLTACSQDYQLTGMSTAIGVSAGPVAIAGAGGRTKREAPFALDGSASIHPVGQPELLEYSWTLDSTPDGAVAELLDADTPAPQLLGDTLGPYVISLVVTDELGQVSENHAETTVEVIPWEDLAVKLAWAREGIDLDVHLVAPGGSYHGDGDCFFGNPEPDWGAAGDASDDPTLERDADADLGPERITLDHPDEGIYSVYVHYYSERHTEPVDARSVLTLSAEGQIVADLQGPDLAPGEVWVAGSIDWADLSWTPSDRVAGHEDLGGETYNEAE